MESSNHVLSVVEYDLYPNGKFDGKSEDEVKSFLLDFRDTCVAHISPLLINYIWQRDAFDLTPVIPTGTDSPPHLHGVTDFGDNIDDEWFIVCLLYQLTTAVPGLVASVQDSDGEFLLIEAAYHLPKWLEPETSINRVFIHQGDIHIIPKPNNPAEIVFLPAGVPTKAHAVETVRSHPGRTLAKPHIRAAVRARVEEFPDKVNSNFHHSHCHVPAKLAAILKHQPSLVAPAVDAFYQRDPLDLKACRVMKHFPPENLVTSQVRFTRCLYAQLVQQPFQPDRRSGWKLPPPASSQFKSADLGMKLAHGFEILCSRCHGKRKEASSPNATTTIDPDDLARGVRWERFLKSLTEKGFFRGELEGSKLYRELLRSAKRFYADMVIRNEEQKHPSLHEPGQQILRLLETVSCDLQRLKEEEQNLPPPDGESWMELSMEELDAMLAKASGKKAAKLTSSSSTSKTSTNHGPQGQRSDDMDFDPSRVTESLKSFVDTMSGLKGVEFPEEGGRKGDIEFDPEEFERAMRNILDKAPDEDDSDSDLLSDRDYQSGGDADDDDDSGGDVGSHDDERIRELMDQMDRELAGTEVGRSFERQAEGDLETTTRMEQTSQANGMETEGPIHSQEGGAKQEELRDMNEEKEEEEDTYRPVEVDLNLLKNILESYSSQQGLAGPASNILHSMGVHVPVNADEDHT